MNRFRLALKGVMAATALTALSAAAVAETVTLRFTDASANRGARAQVLNWMAEEVEKRSGGDLKIEFHWGGALLKARAAMRGIGDGVADMGSIIAAYTPKEAVAYGIGDLPFQNSDPWVGMRAMYELASSNADMKKAFDKQNLVYITNYTSTGVQMLCKGDAVTTLDQIKGVKLRGIASYGKIFKSHGANVVPMSIYKVYQGLDSGLIQCSQTYSYATKALKHYEVADHLTKLDWGQIMGFGIVMNKDSYSRLNDKQRKILHEVGYDLVDKLAEVMSTANDEAERDMAAGINGKTIKVHEFAAADMNTLLQDGQKYVDEWAANAKAAGLPGEKILGQYKDLIAKFEKERDSQGYPWKR